MFPLNCKHSRDWIRDTQSKSEASNRDSHIPPPLSPSLVAISGLYVADELLSEEVYAFGLPRGSVYVEAFDVAISTIFEQNREYPIYNEWLNRATVGMCVDVCVCRFY